MIVPDVNLLIFAHVAASEQNVQARTWWSAVLSGPEPVGICMPVLFGFARITTNRRIFREPMSVDQSLGWVESWLARPQVELLQPGKRTLQIAFDLLRAVGTGADLTTDVQIAAFAIENQAELHSADTDFGRFPGLRWVNPLARR